MRTEEEIRARIDKVKGDYRETCKNYMEHMCSYEGLSNERLYTIGALQMLLWALEDSTKYWQIMEQIEKEEGVWA